MRALRVLQLGLVVAFLPRLGFLVRMLLIMTKRASTPASVLLAWAFFMAVLGVQVCELLVNSKAFYRRVLIFWDSIFVSPFFFVVLSFCTFR